MHSQPEIELKLSKHTFKQLTTIAWHRVPLLKNLLDSMCDLETRHDVITANLTVSDFTFSHTTASWFPCQDRFLLNSISELEKE